MTTALLENIRYQPSRTKELFLIVKSRRSSDKECNNLVKKTYRMVYVKQVK